ncbi:MAG TPA: FAD-dependent oxidoreductase [Paucimonas sp.]|nr:FAD-dependent oxidoreductase [Paucimonas sp.]
MSSRAFDVLIVGAGMVGAACAETLSRRGMRIAVIEREAIGSGATAAGMGHLVVMDDNPEELALTSYSLRLWNALLDSDGAHHEFSRCGTLWIAADDEELDAARLKRRTLNAHDIACELLDAQGLYQLEPRLRPGLAGGLRVSGDGITYPPGSARRLLDLAIQRGVRLLFGTVKSVDDGGVTLGNGERIGAAMVVVANGMGSSALLPELPIRPKKGHLLITDRYPGFIRHQLVELGYIKSAHASDGDSVAFNLQPRPTGQILVGSSRQFDTIDKSAEPAMIRRMLAHAIGYLPELATLNALRCWTGFRAASPDGLPLVGPHPTRRNVWLATGHEGLGITTSLATAELLADQILSVPSAIPFEPYLPSRFGALAEHVHSHRHQAAHA